MSTFNWIPAVIFLGSLEVFQPSWLVAKSSLVYSLWSPSVSLPFQVFPAVYDPFQSLPVKIEMILQRLVNS